MEEKNKIVSQKVRVEEPERKRGGKKRVNLASSCDHVIIYSSTVVSPFANACEEAVNGSDR